MEYIIEAKNNGGTAQKHYQRLAYAKREAARVASAGWVYIPNPELWSWQNWFKVNCVRLYSADDPGTDIDFWH